MSLMEVVVSVALLSIVLMALIGVTVMSNREINESNDRAVGQAAAQQMVEFLNTQSLDAVLAFNGTTFDVQGMTTARSETLGLITTTDLLWDSSTNQAYRVTVAVREPSTNHQYAVINVVRTR
jgi:Tfp pilus assembly protein PilV